MTTERRASSRGGRIIEDEVLGTLRHCSRCSEDWPLDEEFFYFTARGQVIGHCRACQSERAKARYAVTRHPSRAA